MQQWLCTLFVVLRRFTNFELNGIDLFQWFFQTNIEYMITYQTYILLIFEWSNWHNQVLRWGFWVQFLELERWNFEHDFWKCNKTVNITLSGMALYYGVPAMVFQCPTKNIRRRLSRVFIQETTFQYLPQAGTIIWKYNFGNIGKFRPIAEFHYIII